MDLTLNSRPLSAAPDWVNETAFGKWFLSTEVWFKYVLAQAVADLRALAGDSAVDVEKLLDIGCGQGQAFPLLAETFRPKEMIGIDIDALQVQRAAAAARLCASDIKVKHSSVTWLDLPDASVNVVFCHQLIHHLAHQETALRELYRVLKPGGMVLLSESCEPFIHSWAVRYFFRHPEGVQKSAQGYISLVRACGFQVAEHEIKTSTPWWSLPDFGILRRLGLGRKCNEPTEILMVARKP